MSLRPLHLEARIAWSIELDDEVALRITAPGRARALVPLVGLARVSSPTCAVWSTAALLACLRGGVPVVFHDHRGDAVGWCFGPRRRETTLGTLLRQALDAPWWEERFDTWCRAVATRAAAQALAGAGSRCRSSTPQASRAVLAERHRQRAGTAAAPWLRALRRSASALAAQVLSEEVGDARLIGYARPGLHLGERLLTLCEGTQMHLLLQTPLHALAGATPGRWAAVTLEQRGAELHRALGEVLGDLERNLRRWVLDEH